jgi:sarcosine oxidase subunit beta
VSEAGSPADDLVVGLGLVGSALAYHLGRGRAGRVVALDRGVIGGGATGCAAGVLSVQGWDPWDLALVQESAEEYRVLAESGGRSVYRANGGLRVARTPVDQAWLLRVARVLQESGVAGEMLDRTGVEQVCPVVDWSEGVRGLFTPDDACFSPAAVAQEYCHAATRAGVEVVPSLGEVELVRSAGGWRLDAPDRSYVARRVTLAAGAWTKPLAAQLGVDLPLAPFRAQAAILRPRPLQAEFPTIHDLDSGVYIRPLAPGRLLVGDGTEPDEVDPRTASPEASASFLSHATGAVHDLGLGGSSSTLEHAWAGVCAATPDRFPLIGPVAGRTDLYVAAGFNGFGAMRAGGIARRLAEGLREGRWDALAPAHPTRFPASLAPFAPRPEFPLEGDADDGHGPVAAPVTGRAAFTSPNRSACEFHALRAVAEVDALTLPSLSDWFDPFLPLFLRDALRTGGRAEVAIIDQRVRGVYLTSPVETVGSVFTRVRAVAEHYLTTMGPGGLYADGEWGRDGERIDILAADLRDWRPTESLRHPIRIAEPSELPRIRALMAELAGGVDDAWLATLPRPEELCFVAEVDGALAGISWASVVGPFARGHSFMVHPRFRGIGIGTALLHGRMLWLRGRGVRQVVSEIYEGNAASMTAAQRAGMAVVGALYHRRPAPSAEPSTFGPHRSAGRPSPSSR